jgi:hypothetical protein
MNIISNVNRIRSKNKFSWIYSFSYENEYWGKTDYNIATDEGFQVARYYANNNMHWDNAENLKYLGKTKGEKK